MTATAKEEVNVHSSNGTRPLTKDSIINLDHGDPTMFESFWKQNAEEATVVLSGCQSMSYFSNAGNICWFLEPEFEKEVLRIHKLVGNAVTENRYIIPGNGSTQLHQAALFALAPSDAAEPISVVSAAPYYSAYPIKTDYLRSKLYRWAGDAKAFKGDSYIELVCYPNNPDGLMNKAVLDSKNGKAVHDLAYYWPQYTAISQPGDHDIMLFTVSKTTGHAGSRLGWAVVKDENVAKRMVKFLEMNTIGVSKDSQLRTAKIFKVVSDGYEFPDPKRNNKLFDYGREILISRWETIRHVAKTTGLFSYKDYGTDTCNFYGKKTDTVPAFAWLKCEKDEIEDFGSYLKEQKILTRGGMHFGVGKKYVRVSMVDREVTFNIFIERMLSLK